VKYFPIPGPSLEKFIGEINNVFAHLTIARNLVNNVNKFGLIRSAINKGSKEFAGKLF
jgi:hypothetical protein